MTSHLNSRHDESSQLPATSRLAPALAWPNFDMLADEQAGPRSDNRGMDIASIVGLVLGFGSIIIAAEVSHANMALLYEKYEALVLVFGGTLGAAFLSFPLDTCLTSFGQGFRIVLFAYDSRLEPLIERFARFAEVARRDGLLALEGQLRSLTDPSIRRALEMMIDGQDADVIRTVLETETDMTLGQLRETEAFFAALGGYSPTLGIIGTVLGLIAMLGKLGALTESGNIAGSIGGETAAAFIATFLGVFFANILWLPVGAKVKARIARIELEREFITEGILMIQAGDSPSVLRRKLRAYLLTPTGSVARDKSDAASSVAAPPAGAAATANAQ